MTSATVAIHTLALLKKERGETVYNFAAGDPILPSHPKVIEAATTALGTEMVLYPPVAGIPELRKAAAEWCHFKEANTLVTAGGKFAIFAALQTLLQPGDEVLIPVPYWVSYPQMVKLFNAVPIFLQKLNVEMLKKHATARSKILIINNACNPTGVLYSQEELTALMKTAKELGLFVISDEVYSEIVYDGNRFCSCGTLSDNVLVVQSCSKNFAMTGWRVGFAFGPEHLIQKMTALQSQSTSGPSLVSQWAALAALKNRAEITHFVRSTMQKRRDTFIETFNTLFQCQLEKPPSALYAFIPLSVFGETRSSAEFCQELMEKANIACVPGSAFGQEGYIRMAFAETEFMIREGLLALRKVI